MEHITNNRASSRALGNLSKGGYSEGVPDAKSSMGAEEVSAWGKIDIERFWAKVLIGDVSMCWPWQGSRSDRGYGNAYHMGRKKRAHRCAIEITTGRSLPDGLHGLHDCDNPPCCNAAHLHIGTQKQNMQEASQRKRLKFGDQHHSRARPECLARGDRCGSRTMPERLARGDNHYSRNFRELLARGDKNGARTHPERLCRGVMQVAAKLTDENIVDIRRLSADGVTGKILAAQFHVSESTMSAVITRKTWRHVVGAELP